MKHWTLCFYSEPPSAPPRCCHTQLKHIWQAHVPTHTQSYAHARRADRNRQVSMCEDTRADTHTHTPCKRVGNVISCAGCRGRRSVLWRLTPSKSHFQLWTTSRRRQKSGLLFWNTHTHTHKRGRKGLQSVFVCGASEMMMKNIQHGLILHFKNPLHTCIGTQSSFKTPESVKKSFTAGQQVSPPSLQGWKLPVSTSHC